MFSEFLNEFIASVGEMSAAGGESATPRCRLGKFDGARLERRVLYSGVPLDLHLDPQFQDQLECDADDCHDWTATASTGHAEYSELPDTGLDNHLDSPVENVCGEFVEELILIDQRIEHAELLVNDLLSDRDASCFEVRYLPDANGLEAISVALDDYSSLEAVHVLSHGSLSGLQLGELELHLGSVETHRHEIASWSDAFAEGGDLFFYGCDVARTQTGMALLESISHLTGTDVAGSSDVTGSQPWMDWDLEVRVGDIDTGRVLSQGFASEWSGSLQVSSVTVTTLDDVLDAPNPETMTFADLATAGGRGADGRISLREAIVAANNTPGVDEIILPGGTYLRDINGGDEFSMVGDFDIRDDLIIRGDGSDVTNYDGDGGSRAFDVLSGSNLLIEGLRIRGNFHAFRGAGIHIQANSEVTLRDVIIDDSTVGFGGGGGIYNDGILNLEDVELFDNAVVIGAGGSLYNTGTTNLTRTVVHTSSADAGGGIHNLGQLNGIDVVIRDNFASNEGGGLDNFGGQVVLTNVEVSGNSADARAGGINNVEVNASISLTNATVSGNTSIDEAGGIRSRMPIAITNSTIAFNSAGTDGGGIEGQGFTLLNTILAENQAGTGTDNGFASGTSLGHNFSDDTTVSLSAASDQTLSGTTPVLSNVLESNGGFTRSHALLPGSPAIDAGTDANAPSMDVTGKSRFSTTDIGAFEFMPPAVIELIQSPLLIDGNRDGQWSVATDYQMELVPSFGVAEKDANFRGDFRAAWDASYLYFYVEVQDNTPNSDSVDLWQDDSVQIYLDANYSQGTSYDGVDDLELLIRRDGAIDATAPGTFDVGQVDFTVRDEANGYRVEAAIPWSQLGGTPSSGDSLGIDVHVTNDKDGGGRETKIEWADGSDRAYSNPSRFGQAHLSGPVANVPPSGLSSGVTINTDGGNNTYLQVSDRDAVFGDLNQFTYEIRFSTDGTPDSAFLASYHVDAPSNGDRLRIGIRSDGSLQLKLGTTTRTLSGFDYHTLLDDQLHSFAISWDGTAGGNLIVYVDGTVVDATSLPTDLTLPNGGEFILGQEQDSPGGGFSANQVFSGTLYDVRVWDDVRTPEEISLNYQHSFDSGDLPSGLLANWQMDGFNSFGEVVDVVAGNNLLVGSASGSGFVDSTPAVHLSIAENSLAGTSVGYFVPTDQHYQSIDMLLNNDSSFTYDPTTDEIYKVELAPENWLDARTNANLETLNGVAGQLVRIDSSYENNLVASLGNAIGSDVWIGANDIVTARQWRWTDGAADGEVFWNGGPVGSGVNGLYSNWGSGQPSNSGTQNVAYLDSSNGTWQDVALTSTLPYVVEWDASTLSPQFEFSLIDDAGGLFQIDSQSGQLFVDGVLDHEVASVHTIIVGVTDVAGDSYQETMQVHVRDVNESPVVTPALPLPVLRSLDGNPITLHIDDPDVADTNVELSLMLLNTPTHGAVALSGTVIGANDSFTYQDVVDGLLTYNHDGSNSTTDTFRLSVFDGGEDGVGPVSFDVDLTIRNNSPIIGTSLPFRMVDVLQDANNPVGTDVARLLDFPGSSAVTDVDGDDLGIAVIAVDDNNGVWEYSTDLGVTWRSLAAAGVSLAGPDDTNAAILASTDQIRFVPNAGYTGSAGYLEFRAWDGTASASGSTNVDASPIPHSAFSQNIGRVTLDVENSANVSVVTPLTLNVYENANLTFSPANGNAITVTDGSPDDSLLRLELQATDGTITFATTSGINFVEGSTNGSAQVIVEGTESNLNSALSGLIFEPTADYVGSSNVAVTAAVRAGLAGEYLFENGTGVDSSGSANNATSNTATLINDPTRGNVFSYDGVNAMTEIAGEFSQPTDLSISAWVNLRAGTDRPIFSIGNALEVVANATGLGDGLTVTFFDGVTNHYITSSIGLTTSAWQHVAFVFDDTNDVQRLYLDGVEVAQTAISQSIAYQSTNSLIGRNATSSFDGMLDEVRVFGRAISPGEVNAFAVEQIADTDVINLNIISTDPVAHPDSGFVNEGATVTIPVANNDAPANVGLSLSLGSISIVSFPSNGTLTINDDGTVTYAHDGSETNSDSFSYEIMDLEGDRSNTTTVNIAINSVDDAPVLTTTDFGVAEGGSFLFGIAPLDTFDPEQTPEQLVYTISTSPIQGHLERVDTGAAINGFTQSDIDNQLVRYVHNGTESIADSFEVQVSDGNNPPVQGVVSIAVSNTNDAPTANVGEFAVEGGGVQTISGTVLQSADEESTAAERTWMLTTQPSHGYFSLNGSGPVTSFTQAAVDDGAVVYVHNGGTSTSDVAFLQVQDADLAVTEIQRLDIAITEPAIAPFNPAILNNNTPQSPISNPAAQDQDDDDASTELATGDPVQINPALAFEQKDRGRTNSRHPSETTATTTLEVARGSQTYGEEADDIENYVAYWQRRFSQPTLDLDEKEDSREYKTEYVQFTSCLFEGLDEMHRGMTSDTRLGFLPVTLVTTGSAVGWFAWTVRGGYLAASLLSTVSPWTWVDPLPVLADYENAKPKSKRRSSSTNQLHELVDEDDLETMLDGSTSD